MRKIILVVLVAVVFTSWLFGMYKEVPVSLIVEKANKGEAYYEGWLGEMYKRGERIDPDQQRAFEWLKKAVDKKEPISMLKKCLRQAGFVLH